MRDKILKQLLSGIFVNISIYRFSCFRRTLDVLLSGSFIAALLWTVACQQLCRDYFDCSVCVLSYVSQQSSL